MLQDRVMIFIDGSNLFRSCEGFRQGYRPDIKKLQDILLKNRNLVRTYYYCSMGDPPRPEQVKFQDKLKYLHIAVVSKSLEQRGQTPDGKPLWVEKGVDVALVTDMLSMAFKGAYDVAIIVSGDNDLVQAVDEVKRTGRRVEIAFFAFAIGRELRDTGDDFVNLEDIADQICLKENRR